MSRHDVVDPHGVHMTVCECDGCGDEASEDGYLNEPFGWARIAVKTSVPAPEWVRVHNFAFCSVPCASAWLHQDGPWYLGDEDEHLAPFGGDRPGDPSGMAFPF